MTQFFCVLDWALFTTVHRRRVTWGDPALNAVAGKTVTSWVTCDILTAVSSGPLAALLNLTISSSRARCLHNPIIVGHRPVPLKWDNLINSLFFFSQWQWRDGHLPVQQPSWGRCTSPCLAWKTAQPWCPVSNGSRHICLLCELILSSQLLFP